MSHSYYTSSSHQTFSSDQFPPVILDLTEHLGLAHKGTVLPPDSATAYIHTCPAVEEYP